MYCILDTQKTRIVESRCKWVLCDVTAADMFKNIGKEIPWHLNIIITGYYPGYISIDEYLEDDSSGLKA